MREMRRKYNYSVRVAAICFSILFALSALCGAFQNEVATEPAKTEERAPAKTEIDFAEEAERAEEVRPLAKMNKLEGAILTHYCICEKCCGKTPDHPAYGITASGREAEPYVSVAVDPFLIPLGAYVLIDYGDGNVLAGRADDVGSAIVGGRIDLCVSSHQEALELGVKTVDVYWEVDERG